MQELRVARDQAQSSLQQLQQHSTEADGKIKELGQLLAAEKERHVHAVCVLMDWSLSLSTSP